MDIAMLIPAGMLVFHQRRLGRLMHIAYAVAAIVLPIISLVGPLADDESSIWYSLILTGQLGEVGLRLIYPIFLLIWFSRKRVRAEVRLWR
jgi:hypothetical protein